jgi:hypothetical protein
VVDRRRRPGQYHPGQRILLQLYEQDLDRLCCGFPSPLGTKVPRLRLTSLVLPYHSDYGCRKFDCFWW